MWRPDIGDDTPDGKKTRDTLAAVADVEQRKSNEMIGAELGYRYVGSPAICDVPGGPEHLFRTYEPTTWPGARLPHIWLDDGSALQDRIPQDGFTILRLNRNGADAAPLAAALREHKAPVSVLDIPDRIARDIYGYDLLLLRPDLHVVWRGNRPAGVAEVAAIATGHGAPALLAALRS
jgi:hypothetical protein